MPVQKILTVFIEAKVLHKTFFLKSIRCTFTMYILNGHLNAFEARRTNAIPASSTNHRKLSKKTRRLLKWSHYSILALQFVRICLIISYFILGVFDFSITLEQKEDDFERGINFERYGLIYLAENNRSRPQSERPASIASMLSGQYGDFFDPFLVVEDRSKSSSSESSGYPVRNNVGFYWFYFIFEMVCNCAIFYCIEQHLTKFVLPLLGIDTVWLILCFVLQLKCCVFGFLIFEAIILFLCYLYAVCKLYVQLRIKSWQPKAIGPKVQTR